MKVAPRLVMLLLGMMTGCGECEHEYNDEEITKEATCSEEGEKIITCENCGYSYTEPIPVRDDEVVVSVTDKSISSKISEHQLDANEVYNKAVKIDNADLFQYMYNSVFHIQAYPKIFLLETLLHICCIA